MRLLLVIALLLPAIAVAEIYRWVDDNGTVHYGDRPAADGQPADLPTLQSAKPPPPAFAGSDTSPAGASNTGFTVILAQPAPEATYRDARGLVPVSVVLNRPLPDDLRLVYYLDGNPVPGLPARQTSVRLQGVVRGKHRVHAALLREDRVVAAASPVTFFMKPPTSLTPLSQTAPRPDAQQPAGAPVPPVTTRAGAVPAAPRFDTGPR